MRRLLAGLLCALLAAPAGAADVYFDPGCPDGKDGTSATCDETGVGPFNRMHDVFATGGAGSGACSTVYRLRGKHDPHGSCSGGSDGWYYGDEWALGASCSEPTRSYVEPYNYSGPGTGEAVFLSGTRATNATWTQCAWSGSCQGSCASITDQTMCQATWYLTGDTAAPDGTWQSASAFPVWAQKDNGEPTYNVSVVTDLTNAHGGYRSSRCAAPYDWIPCVDATHCPSGVACSASSAEVDSWWASGSCSTTTDRPCNCLNGSYPCTEASGQQSPDCPGAESCNDSADRLFVRWGGSLPSKPYIPYDTADSFAFKANADFMTVRGVNMVAHEGPAVWHNSGSTFNVLSDFRILYVRSAQGQGNAYGIAQFGGQDLTIQDGEIAYTLDEGIHGEPLTAGATRMNMERLWIHEMADTTVMGAGTGTSHCAIIAMTPNQPGPGCGSGDNCDWTGSFWQKNLCENTGASGNGLRIENCVRGLVVRDSIFRNTNTDCIVVDGSDGPAGGQTDNIEIYNNLLDHCGSDGIAFFCSCSVTDTLVWNNTIREPTDRAINVDDFSGTCTGNIFKNNLLADADSNKLVHWTPTDSSNLLQFNLFDTSANPAITWAPATPDDYACADVASAGTGNVDACTPGPAFVSGSNSHITSSSLAKDAGTASGMPAGRTTDINNTLAGSHGLGSYADAHSLKGAAWDIGADEFNPGCASSVGGKVTIGGKVTACSP
jgi:hypothetical protein